MSGNTNACGINEYRVQSEMRAHCNETYEDPTTLIEQSATFTSMEYSQPLLEISSRYIPIPAVSIFVV